MKTFKELNPVWDTVFKRFGARATSIMSLTDAELDELSTKYVFSNGWNADINSHLGCVVGEGRKHVNYVTHHINSKNPDYCDKCLNLSITFMDLDSNKELEKVKAKYVRHMNEAHQK